MGGGIRGDGTVSHNGSNTLWYAAARFNRSEGVAAVAGANDGRPEMHTIVGTTLQRAVAAMA
jgi:hypothetical protein